MTIGTPLEKLRGRIEDQLDSIDSIEELSDARYHETHERFEAASNQRLLILDWLENFTSDFAFPPDRKTRLLSVGCGGGVMDRRITKVFADHVSGLSLVGVDPNPQHTDAFQKHFAREGLETEAHTAVFEDYDSETRFDIIHFVHCLYYFEHIAPELRKAFGMLAPGGALIILQAPNKALNHLADRIWKKQFDQAAWYSDDVAAALERARIPFSVHRIEAEVDVTECFAGDTRIGIDILDFIVQADTRRFSAALQSALRESLRAVCRQQGRRLLCAHPVDAIVARRVG